MMESRVKLLGHPVHPMLIVFPVGLLITAVIFDILYLLSDRSGFAMAAGYTMAVGVLGGLLAAVFGLVDWLAIPAGTRAKRIGALHGLGNVIVVGLFVASWLLRLTAGGWHPGALALTLSFVGAALAVVTSWLGGELVDRLGVGVDDNANLDAPSSLSRRGVEPGTRRKAA